MDALPFAVDAHHFYPYMLVDANHFGRVADKAVGQLGYMHQPVFLDTDIDETAEVGDVGHDAGQFHAFLQVVQRTYILVEFKYLDFLAWVRPGLSSS